jgi:hypothetical protein
MLQMTGARNRLRFDGFSHETRPDGRCQIAVRLEWEGHIHKRACEGLETVHGRLGAAAKATLATVAAAATEKGTELQLVGIKAVRAFDGWVVVTRINGRGPDRTYRLLGSAPCETEEELPKAAARAVLNAINRIVESYVP